MLKITIPLLCRSKKNSQEVVFNTKTGKPFITQNSKMTDKEYTKIRNRILGDKEVAN